MGFHRFAMIAAACCLLAGCAVEQIEQVDRAIETAGQVAEAVGQVAEGPAGPLIPAPVRLEMELAGIVVAAAGLAWQQMRVRLLNRAGQAVTTAVENYADPGGVKELVARQMERLRIETAGRAVVDEWKRA